MKISHYPERAMHAFLQIRAVIYKLVEQNQLGPLEETLKWGQPSYLCATGSTIRVDWQQDDANSIALFFNCKTILVETFREIFADTFNYQGNRAINLPLDKPIPQELEVCLLMALQYHRLKKRPLLGA